MASRSPKSSSKKPTKKPAARPAKKAAAKPAKKPAAKPAKKAAAKPAKKPAAKLAKKPAAKKPAAKPATPATKAATTPAAKPPVAKPAKGGDLLRGVALVEAALAMRGDVTPTDPAVLANTTLGDRPLTPSLQRWLESDADFFTLGSPQSLSEMIASELGEEWVEAFAPAIALLPEPVVLFEGWGSDSRRFIYLGKTDAHGELPVFTADIDDAMYLCLNGPVDVWLAQQAGALEDEHVYGSVPKAYEPARTEHAKLNFDGFKQYVDAELTTEAPTA